MSTQNDAQASNSSSKPPKTYTNGAITIVWKAERCTHSGNCVRGLPDVFKPRERPWINPDAASSEALSKQVDRCPSGALSWYRNAEGPGEGQV